jgi:hypothetical protein
MNPKPSTAAMVREFFRHGRLGRVELGTRYAVAARLLGPPVSSGLSTSNPCVHIAVFGLGGVEIHSVEEVVSLIMFEFEDLTRPPIHVLDSTDRMAKIGPGTTETQFRELMIDLCGSDRDFEPLAALPGSYQVGSLVAYFDDDSRLTALSTSDLNDRWCEPKPIRSRKCPEIIEPTHAGGTRVIVRTANKVSLNIQAITPLRFFALGNGGDSLKRRKAERKAASQLLWWLQDPAFRSKLMESREKAMSAMR